MLLRRMRAEGLAGKELSQAMYNVFQNDIEQRICAEGLAVRASKLLRALERSFYGSAVRIISWLLKVVGAIDVKIYKRVFLTFPFPHILRVHPQQHRLLMMKQ